MKYLLILLIVFVGATLGFAEEVFAPFNSEKGNEAAQKFRKSYDLVYEKFDKSMATSRTFAAKKGDLEEIKKIQAALEGDFSQELVTPTAKSALNSFKSNIQRLCKDYVSGLKAALKAELAAGNIDAAEELQKIIAKLEFNSKVSKYPTKTFRVEAAKSWQASDIEVNKGDKVTLYCTGTWTAYQRNSRQDADTNKVLVKVGDAISIRSGKNSEFNAKKTGKLSFCMDPRLKGKRHSPSGSVSIKVTRTAMDSFQKMHDLALNINGKKTKKEKLKEVKDEVAADKPDKKKPTKRDRKRIRKDKRRNNDNTDKNNDFVPPPPE